MCRLRNRYLCALYIVVPRFTWISNAILSTFRAHQFSSPPMTSLFVDSEPDNIWRRTRRYFEYAREWPVSRNGPYSPLFCVSLLLVVGLFVKISH
jgi:hypothetical protein